MKVLTNKQWNKIQDKIDEADRNKKYYDEMCSDGFVSKSDINNSIGIIDLFIATGHEIGPVNYTYFDTLFNNIKKLRHNKTNIGALNASDRLELLDKATSLSKTKEVENIMDIYNKLLSGL